MTRVRTVLIASVLALSGVGAFRSIQALRQGETKHFDLAVHEATRLFGFEDFLIVPVRIHLLESSDNDALECRLKESDVRRILEKANRIWNKAGIALRMESIVTEQAVVPDGFEAGRTGMNEFMGSRPERSRDPSMVHVYFVHRMPANGFSLGRDAIFVKDTAALREVPGGVDEPLPRVTSHEIGHAMGLPHRQATINLMASGTTGWSINDQEINTVRQWARSQPWVLSPAAAFADKQFEILATIPGSSPLKVRALTELKK